MSDLDFGDMNVAVQQKITNFHQSVQKIEKILDQILKPDIYEKLSIKEKTDYDLFIAFTLNTLYWMYLRTKGEDPNQNEVKNQLARIKEHMVKAKKAHERNTIRPRIDQQVAGRFIKHGVRRLPPNDNTEQPQNKRIKFDD